MTRKAKKKKNSLIEKKETVGIAMLQLPNNTKRERKENLL